METCGQRTRSVGTPARSEAGGAFDVIIIRRGYRRDQKIGAIGENSCCFSE